MPTRRISLADTELDLTIEGAGPPLLLIHGFPLQRGMWRHQTQSLSRSAQVIAPDLRGFGQSGAITGSVSMARFADDLAALLDELEVREPVTVAGHSMGGYVLWQFWKRHAARVGRLIVCNSKAAPDTPEAAENRRKLAEQALADGMQPIVDAFLPKLVGDTARRNQPEMVDSLEAMMQSTAPASAAAALLAMAERADARPWLAELNVPTLFLTGDEDAISTPDENRAMSQAAPGSQFVEIAGAGHMAAWEAPVPFNEAIEEFLSQ